HFAGGGLGQVAKFHGSGALEVGDVLATEGDDLGFGRALAGFQSHKGFRTLAPLLIGDSHNGALHDGRVLGDCLLHFDGRDVLATRDDNVLLAVAQFNVVIGVPYADVTGVEPSSFEVRGSRIGILKVALHHIIAVHNDLAHRLTVARHVVHGLIDNAYVIGGHIVLPLPG